VKNTDSSLIAVLIDRRSDVVREWLDRTFRTYPESAGRFLSLERDPFRNPVGHALKEGLALLFDRVIENTDLAAARPALDGIIRMRAVQDFTAGQAVAFVFLLKQAMRGVLQGEIARFPAEYAALEARIDELALLAFDVFMKCREQIYEIRANEAGRRVSLLERAFQMRSPGPTN
jgi:hypothetical protein